MLRKLLRTLLPSIFYFKDKEGKTIVTNQSLSVVKETVKTLYSLNKYPDWDLHTIVEVNLLTGIYLRQFKPILDDKELRWIESDDDGEIYLPNVLVCVLINIAATVWLVLGEIFYWTLAAIDVLYLFVKLIVTLVSVSLFIPFNLCFYLWMNAFRYKLVERMKVDGTYWKFMEAERNRAFFHMRVISLLLLLLYLWFKFYNT